MRPDILTASGHYFNFLEPEKSIIRIEDIARGLAHTCRFAGQTRTFYSVAQHSVLVSYLVAPEDAKTALMHDAHEAYIGDMTRPLKNLIPQYQLIEARIEQAVRAVFGLPVITPASVNHADLVALASEQRDLMPRHDDEWACIADIEPLPIRLEPVGAVDAEALFLQRYHELFDGSDSALAES
jgi:hypothetical protein